MSFCQHGRVVCTNLVCGIAVSCYPIGANKNGIDLMMLKEGTDHGVDNHA
jgi:hypothetical protein